MKKPSRPTIEPELLCTPFKMAPPVEVEGLAVVESGWLPVVEAGEVEDDWGGVVVEALMELNVVESMGCEEIEDVC